ncbi:MAG TPA: alanine racemase C-terminal domain-containing protein, partial [Candidatus Saccharimonadales bacterium]|nr:alanine racemase C-terminal domain-containing protein [Candidatus Saccharimonadales bacterium]
GFKPELIHIGQSASSVRMKSKYANATRIGLSLYGLNPFPTGHKLYSEFKKNLKPALKFVSTISKVNYLKPGDGVSYNYTFRAKKNMKIAVLPLGYYEGIDWRLSNKGKVKLGEKFLPIVGKVCMNHTMIDISGTSAKVGDEVAVFSDNPDDENSLDNIAARHALFIYELATRLSPDVRRVLV